MRNEVLFTQILLVHGEPPTNQLFSITHYMERQEWNNTVELWLHERGCGDARVCHVLLSEYTVWLAEQEVTS